MSKFNGVSAQQLLRKQYGLVFNQEYQEEKKCTVLKIVKEGAVIREHKVDALGIKTWLLVSQLWSMVRDKFGAISSMIEVQPGFINLKTFNVKEILRRCNMDRIGVLIDRLACDPQYEELASAYKELDPTMPVYDYLQYQCLFSVFARLHEEGVSYEDFYDLEGAEPVSTMLANLGGVKLAYIDDEKYLPILYAVHSAGKVVEREGKKYFATYNYDVFELIGGADEISDLDALLKEGSGAPVIVPEENTMHIVEQVAASLMHPGQATSIKNFKYTFTPVLTDTAKRGIGGRYGTGELGSRINVVAEYIREKLPIGEDDALKLSASYLASMHSAKRVESRDGEWLLVNVADKGNK